MTIHHPALGPVNAALVAVVPGPGQHFTIHVRLQGLVTGGAAQLVITPAEAASIAAAIQSVPVVAPAKVG